MAWTKRLTVAVLVAVASGGDALAQAQTGSGSALRTFLSALLGRLEAAIGQWPAVAAYFAGLPQLIGLRTLLLLVGVVVAGLLAEYAVRRLLQRGRLKVFQLHAGQSPLRAFLHAALLDAVALLALWMAARLVVHQIGDPRDVPGKLAQQILFSLLHWRGFNFIFRIWLRPNTPEGRIAPVDDATAGRLLIGLNVVVLLPVMAREFLLFMLTTGASPSVASSTVVLYAPFIGLGLIYTVWHWRKDIAAWLAGTVAENDAFRPLKLTMAQDWWIAGLGYYGSASAAAFFAALTERTSAAHGLGLVESLLILSLLFEALLWRLTRHLPTALPTVGDLVASCVRLAVRMAVLIVTVETVLVDVLGVIEPAAWQPQGRAIKLAAISAFATYALWRILRYRMDRYIADNPLPVPGVGGDPDDDVPATASRLRTIMPVLRVTALVTVAILGTLLVLSELGINITPLIAGASVLGLAVSFGSQSLVRDIVSGMFFLIEDSFRVGEYIDSGRVKGTVEGFSVRSIRLRHQNGQLHIVPFGQLGHVTNFSRDWTTVKFNLAFALNTDVELLRKTTKKLGLEMMTEPQFQKELLQPLKMQGIVDIKDASLMIRFKFTAKPQNPSLIQRTAIRRLYEGLPKLGIEFAQSPFAALAGVAGMSPAARAAAQ